MKLELKNIYDPHPALHKPPKVLSPKTFAPSIHLRYSHERISTFVSSSKANKNDWRNFSYSLKVEMGKKANENDEKIFANIEI